jgi:hypothetical protein
MTNGNRAGASRPGRRLVLHTAGFVTVGFAVLLACGRSDANGEHGSWNVGEQRFTRSDAEMATQLLQSVAGANLVLCGAVERAFNTGTWGLSVLPIASDANAIAADETSRWIGKNRMSREVLPIAKQGLASNDTCMRRIAARLAGNVDVMRLEDELSAELGSSSPTIRAAAVQALGYGHHPTSIGRLRSMLNDADRDVRLAVIWSFGRLEDDASTNTLIRLLQSDPDGEVRRMAAWSIGQIADR